MFMHRLALAAILVVLLTAAIPLMADEAPATQPAEKSEKAKPEPEKRKPLPKTIQATSYDNLLTAFPPDIKALIKDEMTDDDIKAITEWAKGRDGDFIDTVRFSVGSEIGGTGGVNSGYRPEKKFESKGEKIQLSVNTEIRDKESRQKISKAGNTGVPMGKSWEYTFTGKIDKIVITKKKSQKININITCAEGKLVSIRLVNSN